MTHRRRLAPVALFVFARPSHTATTLAHLAANSLARDTDLIVYSDAARTVAEEGAVQAVRGVIRAARGFRSVKIVTREANLGLARNIIEGVTEVCAVYGRAIILEDDLATSPAFLTFMNEALDFYAEEKRVWHISGWNYPIKREAPEDAFFLRVMNCWGWATWSDRWQHFEKDTPKLLSEFDRKAIRDFDLDDSGVFWSQIIGNHQGRMNTWAIYWYATIFRHRGFCLNPALSYVENIGLDGSGTHGCRDSAAYATALNSNAHPKFPQGIHENPSAIAQIKTFYAGLKPTYTSRLLGKLSRLLGVSALR